MNMISIRSKRFSIALSLVAFMLSGCGSDQMKFNVAREKGLLKMRAGNFEEALEAFAEAEKGLPNDGILQYDIGVSLDQLGQYEEAEMSYSKCIELNPEYERAYNNRAVIYARLKRFEEAIADCSKAIELNASDPLPYRNRGLSLFDMERHKEAIEDFNVSLRLAGDAPETLLSRARAYIAIHQHELAMEDLDKVLKMDDQNADAYYLIGMALRHMNRTNDAELSFAQAVKLDPTLEIPEQIEMISAKPIVDLVDPKTAAESYLKEQGIATQASGESTIFPLSGVRDGKTHDVLLKEITADGELTFSAEEVDAIKTKPICLVLYRMSDTQQPLILRHIEQWTPVPETLKPALFSYTIE